MQLIKKDYETYLFVIAGDRWRTQENPSSAESYRIASELPSSKIWLN